MRGLAQPLTHRPEPPRAAEEEINIALRT